MLKITMIVIIVLLFCCLYIMKKKENTNNKRIIIMEAIYEYQIERIKRKEYIIVNFDDMENYNKTLCRFWDWGYTRILSKYKFQLIKPYIKEK